MHALEDELRHEERRVIREVEDTRRDADRRARSILAAVNESRFEPRGRDDRVRGGAEVNEREGAHHRPRGT